MGFIDLFKLLSVLGASIVAVIFILAVIYKLIYIFFILPLSLPMKWTLYYMSIIKIPKIEILFSTPKTARGIFWFDWLCALSSLSAIVFIEKMWKYKLNAPLYMEYIANHGYKSLFFFSILLLATIITSLFCGYKQKPDENTIYKKFMENDVLSVIKPFLGLK